MSWQCAGGLYPVGRPDDGLELITRQLVSESHLGNVARLGCTETQTCVLSAANAGTHHHNMLPRDLFHLSHIEK